MRDEKKRNRDEEAACVPKKRRSDDSPSQLSSQTHSTVPKPRGHVPMSERQQFALLRQMETEEVLPDKGEGMIDESSDGARGCPSRDSEVPAESILPRDSESGHPSHHHHHHSSRDRINSSISSHTSNEKGSTKHSPIIQGNLLHMLKTGDLDTLKQLVREGANVNEQDEQGWTALHEFSSRNLSRLVAYLLRHGARPDLVDRNGDSALHAAVRSNYVRVVRTLLRHNADPMLKNARGERPLDLCSDTESGSILAQHMDLLQGHPNHSVGKYSSTRVQRHHHSAHGLNASSSMATSSHGTRHSSASAILLTDSSVASVRGPSELNSDSDDACSTPGVGNANANYSGSGCGTFGSMSADLSTASLIRSANSPSGSGQRGPCGVECVPKPPQKKDPYAFEDDTDDCPDPGTSLHPTSLLSKSSTGSGCAVTVGSSTSPTGNLRSRVSGPVGPMVPGTGALLSPVSLPAPSLPHPPGPLLPSPGAGDSSGSETTLSLGPPLRLRFAKEAGHYTLMEQQQQQQQQQTVPNDSSQSAHSPESAELNSVGIGPSDSDHVVAENSRQAQMLQIPTVDTSVENNMCGVQSALNSVNCSSGSGPCTTTDDTESSVNNPDASNDEGNNAQKVPPLRIKFASGTSDSESGLQQASTVNTFGSGDNSLMSENTEMKDHDAPNPGDPRELRRDETKSHGPEPVVPGSSTDHSASAITTGTLCIQTESSCLRESTDGVSSFSVKHKSPDSLHTETHRITSDNASTSLTHSDRESQDVHSSISSVPLSESTNSMHIKTELEGIDESSKDSSSSKDTHRHRSGRTLRSHTAAQREREEKERHNDNTPIKKRKLRSRTEGHTESVTVRGDASFWTSSNATCSSTTATRLQGTDDLTPHDSTDTTIYQTACSDSSGALTKDDTSIQSDSRDTNLDLSKEGACKDDPDEDVKLITAASETDCKFVSIKTEQDSDQKMDASDSPANNAAKSSTSTSVETSSTTSSSATNFTLKNESQDSTGEGVNYLRCPAGPDDNKDHPQLLMFENPFEKSAAIQRKLRELINNLVEVHPKAPCGYSDYLLVTRNYLLASQNPTLTKKTAPAHLKPAFVELFNEQEEERYAQALKHQSEREHLRLCAEQAVLRAQTRAALAVANLSKPLSFCSILAYKDLTYIPSCNKTDSRDEESVRDRFTPRTFFGWLEDIKDTFQQEKKKLLCRQLHEAESLMMVQRLDWECKLKESQLHDYATSGLKEIPDNHVPLIHVPNDFLLFAHDPVHRTSLV